VPTVPQLDLAGGWTHPGELVRQVWSARELCGALARKDFFVRYRRATFGVLWAVALPAIQAVILAVVLSRVARIATQHYALYILSGTVGWTFFSACLGLGATSVVDNASLTSKIYFPRAVLPIAVCFSNLFALVISVVVLLFAQLIAGVLPGVQTLLLLPATALDVILSTVLALTLSALHVYLRDVKYAVQAALLVWFYITPVFYPLSRLHGWSRAVVEANPATGVVQLFHAAVVNEPVQGAAVLATSVWVLALGAVAVVLHCRFDRNFADLL
jgi:lipopolysaccharide transport system permease protein